MDADAWQRVDELFGAAVELAPTDREAFLRERVPDNDGLREYLGKLLDDADRAGASFLEHPLVPHIPASQPTPEDGPDPLLGRTVASYTIQRLLGRGGMGAVYLAEQANPRRAVALKIMQSGFLARGAQRRFEFESRVLARLSHPHIAQVYEAGHWTPSVDATIDAERPALANRAIPYFAMEYVPDARPITRYAAEQGLTVNARVALLAQTCDAVHHGHQRGVIHRDLKPANLLVDGEGLLKVIDFGVARSVDSDLTLTTMHTDAGQLIGTLAYMSPEQCDADPLGIDTRSDVYSLGIVLYELLAGRMPYDVSRTSISAAVQSVRNHLPRSLGLTHRSLRGDIERIVLKCLEKDRNHRYSSAAELADDLRRFLGGEPVAARPPTAWSRTMRWTARHPVAATGAACVALAAGIAIGTMVGLYFATRRPAYVSMEPDGSAAHLAALGGSPVHTWSGGGPNQVVAAKQAEQPVEWGGRRLAILGFNRTASVFPGMLCAFDMDGARETPLWWRTVKYEHLPPDLLARGPAFWEFNPSRVMSIVDLFPDDESPGPEILVSFNHDRSRRAIHIYDTAGTLLYQAWQDGGVDSIGWLSEPGLLVCASKVEALKNNISGESSDTTVNSLFAFRPQCGFLSRSDFSASATEAPLRIVWNQFLSRADTTTLHARIELRPHIGEHERGRALAVIIEFLQDDNPVGQISTMIDEHGYEIAGSRAPDDAYDRNIAILPPLDQVQFTDAPPSDVWRP